MTMKKSRNRHENFERNETVCKKKLELIENLPEPVKTNCKRKWTDLKNYGGHSLYE